MKKILLINAHDDFRDSLSEMLEDYDFLVFQADIAATGLSIAKQIIPDLIISDINIPKMDGYELLEHLRQEPSISQIPLIFLSTDLDALTFSFVAKRAAPILIKPFSFFSLLSTIDLQFQTSEVLQY